LGPAYHDPELAHFELLEPLGFKQALQQELSPVADDVGAVLPSEDLAVVLSDVHPKPDDVLCSPSAREGLAEYGTHCGLELPWIVSDGAGALPAPDGIFDQWLEVAWFHPLSQQWREGSLLAYFEIELDVAALELSPSRGFLVGGLLVR